jgi:hypothetical protein
MVQFADYMDLIVDKLSAGSLVVKFIGDYFGA